MITNQNTSRSLIDRIFYSPDERRLRAGWRLLLQLLLMLVCMTVFVLPLGFVPVGNLSGNILVQLLTILGITLSIYLARRYFDRRSFTSLGLEINRRVLPDIVVGFLLMGILMGIIFSLESLLGWIQFEGFTWEGQAGAGMGSVLANVIPGTLALFILVAWQEELFSRGYQLQNLSEGLNTFWGVILSSAVFAILHLANPNASWIAVLGLIAAGVFLAFGYLRTRQLWLPIGLHLGWNFFEGPVFGFPVSGLTFPTILRQVETGPDLWTGGPFGPEAGLIVFPVLLLGTGLIWLYTRKLTTH